MWDESARAGFTELLPPGHAFPQVDPERWKATLADPAVTMLLAEVETDPRALGRAERLRPGRDLAGFTVCGECRDEDAGSEVGEVRALFVASGRWRRGVGRALMEAALNDLRERGYAEATVWSFAANERANAFYEAQGFERDGTERTEDSWAHIPEVRYRRPLA